MAHWSMWPIGPVVTNIDATLLPHMIVQRTGLLALAGVAPPGARSSALTAVPSMLSHIGGAPAVLCLSPSASSRALLAMTASALSKLQGSSACMNQDAALYIETGQFHK